MGTTDRFGLNLEGRTALVTGATRNIGLAIAEGLLAHGARVVVAGGSDASRLEATVSRLAAQGEVFGKLFPLEDPEAIDTALQEVSGEVGEVDILINNAAVRPHADLQDVAVAEWDRVLAINLRAPFLLSQRLLPGMQQRGFGRIVNISGLDAFWSKSGRPHVVSGKAGIGGLTRALASEAATAGVTVNCVVPGTIDTERHTPGWYPNLEEFYAARTSRIPMGRLGTPDEVASVVLFLASTLASYVTGQTLFATGGAFPMVREAD